MRPITLTEDDADTTVHPSEVHTYGAIIVGGPSVTFTEPAVGIVVGAEVNTVWIVADIIHSLCAYRSALAVNVAFSTKLPVAVADAASDTPDVTGVSATQVSAPVFALLFASVVTVGCARI